MKGIDGQTAVVTGGASGIGRATARRFGQEGANVIVADIDVEGGEETVSNIETAGGEATFVETDVSDPSAVEAMIDTTIETYGGLDLAHNNAGIAGTAGSTESLSIEDWDQVLDTNLRGIWLCMRAELAAMAQTGGAIVNTSSTAGLLAMPGASHYSAAKHGILGLTKTAAFEYAEADIRVNAVCPGVIDTELGGSDDDTSTAGVDITPLDRPGTPEEVADVVVRLCSEDASFVTGIAVPVDGGMTAGRVWGHD